MTMFVKIVRMPGTVSEVAVEDGATVADALSAADMTQGNSEKLTVNGAPATADTSVDDGDRIVLAKEAKNA